MSARFPLAKVKKLIEEDLDNPEKERVIFSAKSRSIDAVIRVHRGLKGRRMTTEQAANFIKYRILELTDQNFQKSKIGQWGDSTFVVDQYGMIHEGVPYFIKFNIDEESDQLNEISFHPMERDMVLASGDVIKASGEKS
ncbi:hypothetical protein D3C87_1787690 [compost metagenome]